MSVVTDFRVVDREARSRKFPLLIKNASPGAENAMALLVIISGIVLILVIGDHNVLVR